MNFSESELIVKKNENLTSDVHHITCSVLDKDFSFESGQFVNIKVPNQEKVVYRAYSIASSSVDLPIIEFCIKVVKDGIASNYLAGLKEGDKISTRGVFGHFVLSKNLQKNKLFIATGTGVAPMRSMIKKYLLGGGKASTHLIFGVRSKEDLFYLDEYKALAEKYSNFKFSLAVSRLEKEDDGVFAGRVTNFLDEKIQDIDFKNTEAYICGSKQMINDVKILCLEKGFDKNNVFNEVFY